MKIIKTTLVAGLISLFATFSTFAEKVTNKEINPATSVVLIIFIISLSINLKNEE